MYKSQTFSSVISRNTTCANKLSHIFNAKQFKPFLLALLIVLSNAASLYSVVLAEDTTDTTITDLPSNTDLPSPSNSHRRPPSTGTTTTGTGGLANPINQGQTGNLLNQGNNQANQLSNMSSLVQQAAEQDLTYWQIQDAIDTGGKGSNAGESGVITDALQWFTYNVVGGGWVPRLGWIVAKFAEKFIGEWCGPAIGDFFINRLIAFKDNPDVSYQDDAFSGHVRALSHMVRDFALDLLLLFFILSIWRYWNSAVWGNGRMWGAIGRIVAATVAVIAWPEIYHYTILIANAANELFTQHIATEIRGEGIGKAVTTYIRDAVKFTGGSPTSEVIPFDWVIELIINFAIVMATLVSFVAFFVEKAIQLVIVVMAYVFGPFFLVFLVSPDTDSYASSFFKVFAEATVWNFIWGGLTALMIYVINDSNKANTLVNALTSNVSVVTSNPNSHWFVLLLILGILQAMLQVPSYLSRGHLNARGGILEIGVAMRQLTMLGGLFFGAKGLYSSPLGKLSTLWSGSGSTMAAAGGFPGQGMGGRMLNTGGQALTALNGWARGIGGGGGGTGGGGGGGGRGGAIGGGVVSAGLLGLMGADANNAHAASDVSNNRPAIVRSSDMDASSSMSPIKNLPPVSKYNPLTSPFVPPRAVNGNTPAPTTNSRYVASADKTEIPNMAPALTQDQIGKDEDIRVVQRPNTSNLRPTTTNTPNVTRANFGQVAQTVPRNVSSAPVKAKIIPAAFSNAESHTDNSANNLSPNTFGTVLAEASALSTVDHPHLASVASVGHISPMQNPQIVEDMNASSSRTGNPIPNRPIGRYLSDPAKQPNVARNLAMSRLAAPAVAKARLISGNRAAAQQIVANTNLGNNNTYTIAASHPVISGMDNTERAVAIPAVAELLRSSAAIHFEEQSGEMHPSQVYGYYNGIMPHLEDDHILAATAIYQTHGAEYVTAYNINKLVAEKRTHFGGRQDQDAFANCVQGVIDIPSPAPNQTITARNTVANNPSIPTSTSASGSAPSYKRPPIQLTQLASQYKPYVGRLSMF